MTDRSNSKPDIIYTKVDEAPELASGSFLPIIRSFVKPAGITVAISDISLAGRILANFPKNLTELQRRSDDLTTLSKLVKDPTANIIKLPNISASVPQLTVAIAELQGQGYDIPSYPVNPLNDEEKTIKETYGKILGSAVNPVLREGNSDRRAPKAVKEFAKKNPHSMGIWKSDSKTHVSTMSSGDFCSNEKSLTVSSASVVNAKIEFVDINGNPTVLKADHLIEDGDIIDGTMMSARALRAFFDSEIRDAKERGILFSLHVKATMMKISDPIIFGHAVSAYFSDVFEKHANLFAKLSVDPDLGIGDLLNKLRTLPTEERLAIEADIEKCILEQPDLYMVNSDRGISNLHVSSDVIIDASLPALIRAGGKAWGADGKENDTKCVIPDSSYAGIYSETIDFCKKYGAFKPSEMGSVSNVGLMARKAEEYGSHPQTFKVPGNGKIQVVDTGGKILIEHSVEENDIWRMSQTEDAAIQNWIKLGVNRASKTGLPAIFWLNKDRAHDAELIKKVYKYLPKYDTNDVDIQIMSPIAATRFTLERLKNGQDTISITGNVLRDYLTDLFPILEVGTSAKMLSIVPLLNGGGLFETGAGGSAPKHVHQLIEEGHLRWDSLGEFCALVASLEFLSETQNNSKALVLANALNNAIEKLLDNNKSPSRKVGEIDNRGSHFYIAQYWAQALATQDDDQVLKTHFEPIAKQLIINENKIMDELLKVQGAPVDLGGYYHNSQDKISDTMRPSLTLNTIIDQL
ncbi:NADP-dependent isocitrate dehydrogenase [Gammaproteobacteria bacterium]|nr:NADP-dependent isocitrate dehydrogenase [Gammaproteobacteria bacterium]